MKNKIEEISNEMKTIQTEIENLEQEIHKINMQISNQREKLSNQMFVISGYLKTLDNNINEYYEKQLDALFFTLKLKEKSKIKKEHSRYSELITNLLMQAKIAHENHEPQNAFSFQTIFNQEDIAFLKHQFPSTIEKLLTSISTYEKESINVLENLKELEKRKETILSKKEHWLNLLYITKEHWQIEIKKYRNSKEYFRNAMQNTDLKKQTHPTDQTNTIALLVDNKLNENFSFSDSNDINLKH